MTEMPKAKWRNVIIFAVLVLTIGNFAGANFYALEGLGGLLFIMSPSLAAIALRLFAGDGWHNFGWRPHLRQNLPVYVVALLVFPLMHFIAIGLGAGFGEVSFEQNWGQRLGMAILTGAPLIFLFALSEEMGWRGYLEPRLSALGVAAPWRFLLVGVIWQLWHLGYIFSQTDYMHLPFALFWPLTMAGTIFMATIYGVMRARTNSFWPAALAHGVGNMLAWPLLDPNIVTINQPVFFAARPEGLVVLFLLGSLAAAMFWRHRQQL